MITLEMLLNREREITGALAEVQGMIAHVRAMNAKEERERSPAPIPPATKPSSSAIEGAL